MFMFIYFSVDPKLVYFNSHILNLEILSFILFKNWSNLNEFNSN
jgi:hypothetical protein